jgi:hypothetical protein
MPPRHSTALHRRSLVAAGVAFALASVAQAFPPELEASSLLPATAATAALAWC